MQSKVSLSESTAARRRTKARCRALTKLKKMWSSFNRAIVLQALKVESLVLRKHDDIMDSLGSSWAPTFHDKTIDVESAKQYAEEFSPIGCFADVGLSPLPALCSALGAWSGWNSISCLENCWRCRGRNSL